MALLFLAFHKSLDENRPIESAALLHTGLVGIHPFKDGNGREARMLMNIALMQGGLPPLFFASEHEYDQAADRAHEEPASFAAFLHEKMEDLQETLGDAAHTGAEDPYAYAEHLPLMRNIQRIASHPNVQMVLRDHFSGPQQDHKEREDAIEAAPPIQEQLVEQPSAAVVPVKSGGLSRRTIQVGIALSVVAILAEIYRRTVYT